MEAIAALSLACNIIQLAGIATKSVTICKQAYDHGATIEQLEYRDNCNDLRKSYLVLEQSLSTSPRQQDAQIGSIANKYINTSKQLDDELQKLDPRVMAGSATNKLRKWSKAIRSTWKAGQIDEIKAKLDQYEKVMDTQILVRLSITVQEMDKSTRDSFIKTDQQLDAIITKLESGLTCTKDLMVSLRESLQRVEAGVDTANVRIGDVKTAVDLEIRQKKFKELEASLKFEEMFSRQESIKDHHRKTFRWIFKDVANAKWSNFSHWLQGDDQFYWIFGKPGSGKSTLMNYLVECSKTVELLARDQHQTPIIAKFFFWEAGSSALQRSTSGLLRSLLIQLLRGPDKEKLQKWVVEQSPDLLDFSGWSEKKLIATIKDFHAQTSRRMCYFIDGLDECDDQQGLLEAIKAVKSVSNLKICVSSRPERIFEIEFDISNKLKLEDFTRGDIDDYVRDRLQTSLNAQVESIWTQNQIKALVEEIGDKAEGVFLWVYLVVRFLNDGFRNGDDIALIRQRLDTLPTGIFDLYTNMWNRTRNEHALYSESAAMYFHLLLCGDMSLVEFAIANDTELQDKLLHPDYVTNIEKMSNKLADYALLKIKITARCAGLIEVRDTHMDSEDYSKGNSEDDSEDNSDSELDGDSEDDSQEASEDYRADASEGDPKSHAESGDEVKKKTSLQAPCRLSSEDEWSLNRNTKVCFIHRTVEEYLTQDKRGREILATVPDGFRESQIRRCRAFLVLRAVGVELVSLYDVDNFMWELRPELLPSHQPLDGLDFCDTVVSNMELFVQIYSRLINTIAGVDHDEWYEFLTQIAALYYNDNDNSHPADFLGYVLGHYDTNPGVFEFVLKQLENHSRSTDRGYLSHLLFYVACRVRESDPKVLKDRKVKLLEFLLARGGDPNMNIVQPNKFPDPDFSDILWNTAIVRSPWTQFMEMVPDLMVPDLPEDVFEMLCSQGARFSARAFRCYGFSGMTNQSICLVRAETLSKIVRKLKQEGYLIGLTPTTQSVLDKMGRGDANLDTDGGHGFVLLRVDSRWCEVSQRDARILSNMVAPEPGRWITIDELWLREFHRFENSREANLKRSRICAKAREIYARSTTYETVQEAFASLGISNLDWELLVQYIDRYLSQLYLK